VHHRFHVREAAGLDEAFHVFKEVGVELDACRDEGGVLRDDELGEILRAVSHRRVYVGTLPDVRSRRHFSRDILTPRIVVLDPNSPSAGPLSL
jgi:hypothetical protein